MKCLIIDAVHSAIAEELGNICRWTPTCSPPRRELVKHHPDYECAHHARGPQDR
ncbi:MAG: hypothetical protein ACLUJG_10795 [Lawsonibacter sp.]